ncbi:MAG: hypothetical protein ACT4O3_05605 [Elusimicrobiota bacterium]
MTDPELSDFDKGYILGLLIGEGHFGGDGLQPQITLRMHVRHELVFRWLQSKIPAGRLYGPYHHAERHYFQWMLRGEGLKKFYHKYLKHMYVQHLDRHVFERIALMEKRYANKLGLPSSSVQAETGPEKGASLNEDRPV